jgi:limonene 1,2-monooxygenase
MVSPSGPRAAGRFGCSLLSIGATQTAGFDMLGSHWQVMEERAQEFDTTVDRRDWRLVGPIHIADTKEQAYRDVEFGLADWLDYFRRVAALPLAPQSDDSAELADQINASGVGVIGTPDDAIAQIERLEKQSGGFGAYLVMAHEWADRAETLRSYELMSRYVMPRFQASAETTTASRDWAAANHDEFMAATGGAIMSAIQKHAEEREARKG